MALGMLRNKEDAHDAAQEAFVRVYRYLPFFKGDASFYTWLFRIVNNICIDMLRKKGGPKGRFEIEFDEAVKRDIAEAQIGTLGSMLGTNPQKSALRKELAEKIMDAIGDLPENHRQVLLLREVEGMSYEDIARTIGIKTGTVMSRLFHARLKMQAILNRYLELDEAKAGVGSE